MKVFCFGFAQSLEHWYRHRPPGVICTASARTPEKAARLETLGITPILWTPDNIAARKAIIRSAEYVIVSAGPRDGQDPFFAGLAPILADASNLKWLGYLSSTNVYGNHDGGWVDETTPPAPTSPRGEARLAAENQWLGSGLPAHVFRLAGIYGSDRNPLRRLRENRVQRIVKPDQIFSRIHEADIAAVLAASMAAPNPGAVYNLADDTPANPDDVLAFASQLSGIPLPPPVSFDQAGLSGLAAEFYRDNKRVRNDRIKTELSVRLQYPDYRAGLTAIWNRHSMESSSSPA